MTSITDEQKFSYANFSFIYANFSTINKCNRERFYELTAIII